MNEIDVIELFLTEISNLGYNVDTSYDESEDPYEKVIIDSWDSREIQNSNTTYRSDVTDSSGNSVGEHHHHYKEMDVELEFKSEDELTAHQVRTDIVEHFRTYKDNPTGFHSDTVQFEVGGGGMRSPAFEPTSLKLFRVTQNFSLHFVNHDERTEGYETLENIETNQTIN